MINTTQPQMATTVTMHSEDRNLFGIIVPQDSKTSFLMVSALQEAFDKVQSEKGWAIRRIADVMETDTFLERCYYLLKEDGKLPELLNTNFSVFKDCVEAKGGINKVLRELGWWKLTGKGTERRTWCNPYIWVTLALEMNPEIFAKVVKWLTDGLIRSRIECAIKYLPLTEQIKLNLVDPTQNPSLYARVAIEINKKVFGRHETDIRNVATKDQLARLSEVEVILTGLFKIGVISDLASLQTYIKKL